MVRGHASWLVFPATSRPRLSRLPFPFACCDPPRPRPGPPHAAPVRPFLVHGSLSPQPSLSLHLNSPLVVPLPLRALASSRSTKRGEQVLRDLRPPSPSSDAISLQEKRGPRGTEGPVRNARGKRNVSLDSKRQRASLRASTQGPDPEARQVPAQTPGPGRPYCTQLLRVAFRCPFHPPFPFPGNLLRLSRRH